MNANIRRLGFFFIVAFGIILADVTYWQVIDASNMTSRADNFRNGIAAGRVRRGYIFDRNGTILADRTIDAHNQVHRSYTDPSLSQVIGYDNARYGKSGLERQFDPYLTGDVFGNSWQGFINQLEHKPITGDNLTLTIDDRLQRKLANLLPNSPSAAIVADPRNGEILAMAGNPGFDANQIGNSSYWSSLLTNPGDPLIDRPIDGYYPPGSTFKIMTLSSALDSQLYSLNTLFSGTDATGPLVVDSHQYPATINNLPPGVGAVTLEQAFAFSDNIVFARVGLSIGQRRFLDYAHRYGLGSPLSFDLPVAVSRVRTPGEAFNRVDLASTAFGQGGLHVTPLQMLMIGEAQANGGAIPRPVLVQRISAPDGTTVKSAPYGTVAQPISPTTAGLVRDAMVQVVAQGSGFKAQIPGIDVAGKTGTAETGDGRPPHAWFVCFAPADHPRVAVAVIVEHGGEGAFVAAPLARSILLAALPLVH